MPRHLGHCDEARQLVRCAGLCLVAFRIMYSEVDLTATGMAGQHLALWSAARQDSLTNRQHVPPLPPS